MKILIIRLSSIGDIILTTPVIKAFKEKYPESQIDFLVLSQFRDTIRGNPYLNKVHLLDKNKNDGYSKIREFAKGLKKENYDYVFDLHDKLRSRIISKTIGVKTYRYKKRKFWKSILVKIGMIKYRVDNTIIKNYFGAFKDFKLDYNGENLGFYFDEKDLEEVKDWKGYGVIAPGASKETKKWPAEYYGELAEKLYLKYNKPVLILGGTEDKGLAKIIMEKAKDGVIDLTEKLTLKESGALLSQSHYLVCNDSAPFHMGRAFKVPAFVFFGPTSPKMFEFNDTDNLMYHSENCSPCSLHGDKKCNKGHFNCMRKVTPDMAMKIIEENLG